MLWCAALPFQMIEASLEASHARPLFQAYLVLVCGVYFVAQWARGGQTLPMKTWRLRLVAADGSALSVRQAALRYVVALAGMLLAGVGFLWALFDRDHQFLHDRLARTRIVRVPKERR
jgi:uncharacterized RDD family membrane protein YckC